MSTVQVEQVRFELVTQDSKVKLAFAHDINKLVLDPPTAVRLAKGMIDAAVSLGYEVQMRLPLRPVSDQQRTKLTTRVTHIIRSMSDSGTMPARIAVEVVDTVLAEVA